MSKTAWYVETYVRSEFPLTAKVPAVMQFSFVVIAEEPPSSELVYSLVALHTRNVTVLFSEVSQSSVPDDRASSD